MKQLNQSDGKELWLKIADSDGWISKNASQAAEILFEDSEEQYEAEKALNMAQNYFDIEFENDKEERWRFVEKKILTPQQRFLSELETVIENVENVKLLHEQTGDEINIAVSSGALTAFKKCREKFIEIIGR